MVTDLFVLVILMMTGSRGKMKKWKKGRKVILSLMGRIITLVYVKAF